MIAVHARKRIFGYRAIAFSSLGIAGVSFIVWGHHMFTSQGELASIVFSALTFLVAIPTAIKVFNWIATLYKGSIAFNTPMLYTLSFLFLFTIGGLTGLPLATLSTDLHLHDSYFVVAHFHYVMMGSTLVAFIGALHYWWPKLSGRMYPESLGKLCAWGVFLGFNLTFLPQFVMGSRGMPRRYWDYDPEYTLYHRISTVGAFILGVSMFTVVVYLAWSLKRGKKATQNPWGASTLEWVAPTPPTTFNFPEPPPEVEIYNYDDLEEIENANEDGVTNWERRPAANKVATSSHH
jgi:cytochrome c oxidase subunit 1